MAHKILEIISYIKCISKKKVSYLNRMMEMEAGL